MRRKNVRTAIKMLPQYCPDATKEEVDACIKGAQNKLDMIIKREGNLQGVRLNPSYLSMLLAEQIKQRRVILNLCHA